MALFKTSALVFCLIPLFALAESPNYFELDLRDPHGAQATFPDWLSEITEQGGSFNASAGWTIPENKPFGIGRLYLSLAPEHPVRDLALSFFSKGTANIAVQLYDADEQTLAVDLLAARSTIDNSALTSLIIPLSQYPTARHIVLRRLDGEVSVSALSLIELIDTAPQSDASLAQLATLLGDPLSPDNPLVASLSQQSTAETSKALLASTPSLTRPFFQLSQLNGESPYLTALTPRSKTRPVSLQ